VIEATVVLQVRHLDSAREGIGSLLAQTMPAEKMELVIVDAGLEDHDAKVLRDMAAEEPRLRLVSPPIAESSAPTRTGLGENGGFRFANAGLDQARGEYIMFVCPSRILVPDTLERLYALGNATQGDVVLSRTGDPSADLPSELLHYDNGQSLRTAVMLLDELASDKLLRTSFLRTRGIRFRAVCETLMYRLFTTEALCGSATITIDSDAISARSRRSKIEASSVHLRTDDYGSGLRQILDVIDAGTESESVRAMFILELLQNEVLKRIGRPELASQPTAEAWMLVEDTRSVWKERIPLSLDEGLGYAQRAMAAALRSGSPEEIAELAVRIAHLQPRCWLTAVHFEAPPDVKIGIEVRMQYRGQPLRLLDLLGNWMVPSSVTGSFVSADRCRLDDTTQMSAEVVLRHQSSNVEVSLPSTLRASIVRAGDHGELVWSGSARLDPQSTAIGQLLDDGRYDVLIRIRALGLVRQKRLGPNRLDDLDQLPLMVKWRGRIYEYAYTGRDNLSLAVGARASSVFKALRTAVVVLGDDGLVVNTGVVHAGPNLTLSLSLTPQAGGATTRLRLTPGKCPGHWTAQPGRHSAEVGPGTYRPALNIIFRSSKSRTLLRRSIPLKSLVEVTDPLFCGRLRGPMAEGVRQKVAAWSRLTKQLRRSLHRTTS
jgi:poly(ribitol-phosphate) beta-N-acetylglucosaminyltransferase